MPCRLCTQRGKTWNGDDPKCAFEHENFSYDNWNCATMNTLRELAMELGVCYRDDLGAGSFGAVPIDSDKGSGYIVMIWYKNRGKTDGAYVLWDNGTISKLDEEIAFEAISYVGTLQK